MNEEKKKRTQEQNYDIYRMYREKGHLATRNYYGLNKDTLLGIVSRVKLRQARWARGVSLEQAEKLRAQAKRFSIRKNFIESSDDFASYCVLRLYENKQSCLEYMFVDFKRLQSGQSYRNPEKTKRGSTKAHLVPIGEEADVFRDERPRQEERLETYTEAYTAIESADLLVRERVCFILHSMYGFNQKEIGTILGVTESRVCQLIGTAGEKMRKKNDSI